MFTSNEYITKLSRADFLADELRVLVVMQTEDFRRASPPCPVRRAAVYCPV